MRNRTSTSTSIIIAVCALLAHHTAALAESEYCGDVPDQELRFSYVWNADQGALILIFPRSYQRAKFRELNAWYGNEGVGKDVLHFRVASEPGEQGTLTARIGLPRGHESLRLSFGYATRKWCLRDLEAVFVDGDRISNPPPR